VPREGTQSTDTLRESRVSLGFASTERHTIKVALTIRLAVALLSCASTLYGGDAFAITYRQCATVEKANGDIDGENRGCGETRENPGRAGGVVQCAYVMVTIPPGWKNLHYRRTKDNIGWAAWLDDINVEQQTDGTAVLSTGLKNWSDNRARNFCLEVDVD
jgi:hypothetical protein